MTFCWTGKLPVAIALLILVPSLLMQLILVHINYLIMYLSPYKIYLIDIYSILAPPFYF